MTRELPREAKAAGPSPESEWQPRAQCHVCRKPRSTCVCNSVHRVQNRTRVVVLQHPRERFHPIGTVRLLELGLTNVQVEVAFHELGTDEVPSLSRSAALLYPGPQARDLATLAEAQRPDELVVIDGTWHHARALHRDFDWLQRLPCVTLTPREPSRYRIRREPRAECLSTVEAVVAALQVLEPETPGLDALLDAFDSMIDVQLQFIRSRPGGRRPRRLRARAGRALPKALAQQLSSLVAVYAETALGSNGRRELVQLTALRVQSGELFERIVARVDTPGLDHMGLTPGDVAAGITTEELRHAWREFRLPTDLVAAWNQSTLDALAAGGLEHDGLLLKGVYANAVQRAPGTLEDVLRREQLSASPLPLHGRASQRLANVGCIALSLSRLAHAPR